MDSLRAQREAHLRVKNTVRSCEVARDIVKTQSIVANDERSYIPVASPERFAVVSIALP